MRETYNILAPPGFWGPSTEIAWLVGQRTYEINFNTISQAPSTFEIEVEYWQGAEHHKDVIVGPGNHRFSMGSCACVARIRAKSHSLGQNIEVIIDGY